MILFVVPALAGIAEACNLSQERTQRWLRCGAALGIAFTLFGCSTPPSTQPPAFHHDYTIRETAPPILPLMDSPRAMREDYAYPPDLTKRSFAWIGEAVTWKIRFPPRRFAYSGFIFFYPRNFLDHVHETDLIFDVAPASMARHLWVGLIDGLDDPARVLVEAPLVANGTPNPTGNKPVTIRIPLSAFGTTGLPVGETSFEASTQSLAVPFNWVDVREIRFISHGGRIPNRDVMITNLRFERPSPRR